MIALPDKLRSRPVFALMGAVLGGVFALTLYGPGTYYLDDRLPGTLGAIIGGAVFAALTWPTRHRPASLMIMLGVLALLAAIFSSYFSVGFFSEREIASRDAGGIGTWVGSFFGSWLMAVPLGLFSLIGPAFLALVAGGVLGWLFRDPNPQK